MSCGMMSENIFLPTPCLIKKNIRILLTNCQLVYSNSFNVSGYSFKANAICSFASIIVFVKSLIKIMQASLKYLIDISRVVELTNKLKI